MSSTAIAGHAVFEVDDTVTWQYERDPRSSIGRAGPGPFVVLGVSAAEVDCQCPGHIHHYPARPDCPNKSTPSHPQMVSVGDPETGEFLGCLSGSHLAKAVPT